MFIKCIMEMQWKLISLVLPVYLVSYSELFKGLFILQFLQNSF